MLTDGHTDPRTDGRTDTPYYATAHLKIGLVEECDPVIFCLKFCNQIQSTFEMIKAWQIDLGLGLKLGLGLELRVRVKVRI